MYLAITEADEGGFSQFSFDINSIRIFSMKYENICTMNKNSDLVLQLEWKKYWNKFQEHDFLRDLNFALCPLVLRSREEKDAKFKFRKKSCSWNLF